MSGSKLRAVLTNAMLRQSRTQSNVATLPVQQSAGTPIAQLPGPYALPYLGSADMLKVMFSADKRSNLHTLQNELVKKHGSVFRLNIGPNALLACADPELMQEVIKHEDPVPVRREPVPWIEYIRMSGKPTALLTSQHEDWDRKRKAIRTHLLKPNSMDCMVNSVDKVSTDFCNILLSKQNDGHIVNNLVQELYRWAFEGIVMILFGSRAGVMGNLNNPQGTEFINGLTEILDACFNSLMILAPIQRKLGTRRWRDHVNAWNTVGKSVNQYVDTLMNNLESLSENNIPLYLTLVANNKLSSEELESMLAELLFGGVDTTSNSMSFLLYNMASHPEKQDKLREEIASVLNGEKLTLAHIQRMSYLRNCIKESLRLYPVLIINGRDIKEEFVSTNYNIAFKPGDNILFFHYAMGRSEKYWDQADQFLPERYEREFNSSTGSERKFVSVPFGFGTRGCIGKRVAELEMSVLLIKMLERFDLRVDETVKFQPVSRSILTPGKILPVKFIERK